MTQVSITSVVRNAYSNNKVRTYIFKEVANTLGVPMLTAKKLCFSFLYFPTEETLQNIVKTGLLPNEKKPS